MQTLRELRVEAGQHTRTSCPVQIDVNLGDRIEGRRLALWDRSDGKVVPMQAQPSQGGAHALCWILDRLPAGASKTYEVRKLGDSEEGAIDGVAVTESGDGKLQVAIGGRLFTTYNYGGSVVRPYFYPILMEDGAGVTRNWPMVEGREGETTDHQHHRGLYTAHGEVNGIDNWGEAEGHGWQVHQGFDRLESGPVTGGFSESLSWTDAKKTAIMSETRRVSFYATPIANRLLDYDVTLRATGGGVTLGDTKEGGLISIRVASSMDVERRLGGRILNGYGGVQQAETWGRRAPWCDYSGPVGERRLGVCLMDHPENPRYPTFWHVRDYGLMTANCFGVHDFCGDPSNMHPLVIPDGASLTWRYRVLFHSGRSDFVDLSEQYHGVCNPPEVRVLD